MAPPVLLIVKMEFPAPSQVLLTVILGGIFVAVGVRVLVGVGVTQKAAEEAICMAAGVVPFFIATERLPYRPLMLNCWVLEAASKNVPLVRNTPFWYSSQV